MTGIAAIVMLLGLAAVVVCIVAAINPFAIGPFQLLNNRKNALIGIPVAAVGTFVVICMFALADISAHPEKYPTEESPPAQTVAAVATSSAPQPVAAPAPSMPGVGDKVALDKTEITLTKSITREKVGIGNQFVETSASDGGVLVVLEYKIRNISERPLKHHELPTLKLVDPKGTVYSSDLGKAAAYATEIDSDAKIMSDLNPDIAVTDSTVFEVSKTKFDPATWHVVTSDGTEIALK